MKTYKVWVCVERCDDKTDKYEDIDLNFAATAEYKSQRHARDFAEELHALGEKMHNGSTPNGYDPLWVAAINNVLSDREHDLRITDITEEVWDEHVGPMIDAVEDGDVEVVT